MFESSANEYSFKRLVRRQQLEIARSMLAVSTTGADEGVRDASHINICNVAGPLSFSHIQDVDVQTCRRH